MVRNKGQEESSCVPSVIFCRESAGISDNSSCEELPAIIRSSLDFSLIMSLIVSRSLLKILRLATNSFK